MDIDGTCSIVVEEATVKALGEILANISSLITNAVPSARSILKPVLFVFITFDDFFPYMFHERDYGRSFESLFQSIHNSETEKWSSYDKYLINPLLAAFGMDKDKFEASCDPYLAYSSPKSLEWDGHGESALLSTFSFLTTNFALSLILFVIGRVLFRLLFSFRISLLFRSYSFWPYLVFFVMEGNLQIVTFYACSVLRFCFFFSPSDKIQAAVVFFGLYFLILFSVAGYFFVFQRLGPLTKYFCDNVRPTLHTSIFLTIEYGIKNLLLAMVHSLLRSRPLFGAQFACLGAIELLCLANYIAFLMRKNVF